MSDVCFFTVLNFFFWRLFLLFKGWRANTHEAMRAYMWLEKKSYQIFIIIKDTSIAIEILSQGAREVNEAHNVRFNHRIVFIFGTVSNDKNRKQITWPRIAPVGESPQFQAHPSGPCDGLLQN